ncbi:MAG: nicotinate-nucleotide adenylyltransferase [Dehalococcoidia bacterium]|jgi:nicotinate-nucleotide adenylyltransferase
MKLGILGGTFDPPHVGHLRLAEAALSYLSLDRVLFVPAGEPWRKTDRQITAAEHRLAMTRLAIGGNPQYEVSTLELERPGPSYTVDTLGDLLARYGADAELYLILGQDALLDLPNWKEPRRIIALAWLAVALRSPGRDLEVTALEEAIPGISRRLTVLPASYVDVSGTALREWARKGVSLDGLVPPAVEAYIKEHTLYAPQG